MGGFHKVNWVLPILADDLLDTSHRPALQPDLDPMRMGRRLCEDVFDNAFSQLAGALILLEDNQHGHARLDGRAGLSVHDLSIAHAPKEVTFSIHPSARKIKHL